MNRYLFAALLCSPFALAFTACPPQPVTPDAGSGGSPGTGGSVVVDAGPVDASKPPDAAPVPPRDAGAACSVPTGPCCRSCAVLAAHGCPEALPTVGGLSCESVCLTANGSHLVTMPDVSGCATLACIQKTMGGSRACAGGK
jgi:hypothetical protein